MHKDDEDKQSSGQEPVSGAPAGSEPERKASEAGASKRADSKAANPKAVKPKAVKPKADPKRKGPKGGASKATPNPRIKAEPNPRMSRSLEYGIAILESFSSERQSLGIAEMADIVGVSRSTTHRYAMTLVVLGYLEQDSKRKYRLAGAAAGPGAAVIGAIRRQLAARAVLVELRDETGYTVSMGVLDGSRVIYVDRFLGHRPGQYAIDSALGVGAGIPAYCTALGKVLLASVSDAERSELLASIELTPRGPKSIRRKKQLAEEIARISPREVVLSDEELTSGARSIAALVPRPSGEHPLAIDITVPSSAYTAERLVKELAPRLKRAAILISGE